MKKIASFQVNHDTLTKGVYISRIDGDIITYDIRMKLPNQGDFFDTASGHTFEHLLATFVRNSIFADSVIYAGPMGCRTGFYLLLRDSVSQENAIKMVKDSMDFIADYQGEIPGNTAKECGNYLDHNLEGARALAKDMVRVLAHWTVDDLRYKE